MTRRSSRWFALTIFCLLLCSTTAGGRKPRPRPCMDGRFLVRETRLIPGSEANEAVVIAGSRVAIAAGCHSKLSKVKANGTSTRVVARWSRCNGLSGSATLAATVTAPDCGVMTGVFKARRSRIPFTATRSVCGDGIFDPDRPGEQCEGDEGCGPHEQCTGNCTCEPRVVTGMTTTTQPRTSTTTLPHPVCGDAVVVSDEVCDPPGKRGGCPGDEVCGSDCRSCTSCGNGTVDPGETCDPTSGLAGCGTGDLCSRDCKACLRAVCETCTPGTLKMESPQALEFGAVSPGARQTIALTIRNTSAVATSQLHGRLLVDNASFAVDPPQVTLGPNGSASVTVAFAPVGPGHQSSTLTLVASASNRPVVRLLAHGFGGSAPGTGPTFASEPLFFADLAGSTQQILPDGTRLPADNTLHSCQNAHRTGSSDLCARDQDCVAPGETCTVTSACVGGSRAAQVCTTSADCPGGFCRSSSQSSDPVDICADGTGGLYIMTDIGTFTDPNPNASTALSTSIVGLQFDPRSGARIAGNIVARTTDETQQIACDRTAAAAGGLVYVPEFFNVDSPPTPCSRDQREALTAFSKSTGEATVIVPDIAAAAGYGECDDFDSTADLEIARDGSAIFASLPLTGLSRIHPTRLAISPDIIDYFQIHPDGRIVYVTTSDSVTTGSLDIYEISPDEAAGDPQLLANLTPCTVHVPNNGGRTQLGLSSYAVGQAASGSSDAVLLVSFITTGGLADLGLNLLVRGTVAVRLPARGKSPSCTILEFVNVDFFDPMTF